MRDTEGKMTENIKPIVLDLETSGLDLIRCGIWQIGAIDLNTMEEFFDEARIDDEDEIEEEALKIIGKTAEELRDSNKQSQKELIEKFMKWFESRKMKNFVCQNPQFDMGWILTKLSKYGLERPFHHRAFDLHSIAQAKFKEINGKFSIEEGQNYSCMGLTNVLKFCGIDDNRGAHNALEDAKLTAECFVRLTEGKNLFQEYAKFEVPTELKK